MAKETKELTIDDKFQMLLEVLASKQAQGFDMDALKTVLTETQNATAKAMQKALKPENADHPAISAFSKPKGDVADPKAVLPFEFFYNGYPSHMFLETEHWREVELMAQVVPGEYSVLRKDGSKMAVTVKGERDADNKVTKILVEFPVSREDKWLVPPKSVVLYQIVYSDNPRKRFVEAMQEHLSMVLGEATAV